MAADLPPSGGSIAGRSSGAAAGNDQLQQQQQQQDQQHQQQGPGAASELLLMVFYMPNTADSELVGIIQKMAKMGETSRNLNFEHDLRDSMALTAMKKMLRGQGLELKHWTLSTANLGKEVDVELCIGKLLRKPKALSPAVPQRVPAQTHQHICTILLQ